MTYEYITITNAPGEATLIEKRSQKGLEGFMIIDAYGYISGIYDENDIDNYLQSLIK